MHIVRLTPAVRLLVLLTLTIGLSGCGGAAGGAPPTPTSVPPTERPATNTSQPKATTASGGSTQSRQSNGPTCRDWQALDNNVSLQDRLAGKENKEQQDILKQMLSAHGKDTGDVNRTNAEAAIIQFCFPDGTGTRPNIDRPIEDAIDWS